MKKLIFSITIFTAMFLMIACGGSDSKNNDNNNQNQSSGVCTYGTYECHGEDLYFCGYGNNSNDLIWLLSQECESGCDTETSSCKCSEGFFRCVGDMSQKCHEEIWRNYELCTEENPCNTRTGKCAEDSNSGNGDYEDPSNSDSESEEPTCEVDDNLTWSSKSESMMTWEQAISYCENLSEEGVSDWRLPTICELRSLIQNCPATEIDGSCTFTDNCLNVTKCINTDCIGCSGEEVYSKFGDLYGFWSSSEAEFSAGSTKMAFSVNFSYGSVDQNVTSLTNYVRCVRNAE